MIIIEKNKLDMTR